MNKWKLVIDIAKCEGCNNCLLSCKDEHVGNDWPGYARPQQLHGDHWVRIPKQERGEFPHVDVAYRPTPCMHCEDPACARALPEAFTKRPDGIVLLDSEKAKGHKELLKACPYGAIQWNEDLQMPQKCTFCAHLLDDGWDKPRCVQSCPTGALRVVKVDDATAAAMAVAEGLEPLCPEFGTKPRVLYANMHRFEACFVAGSVSVRKGDIQDCVKGAAVRLYRNGAQIGEATTDAFGDFRFDRLGRDETGLSLKVQAPGFKDQQMVIEKLSRSAKVDVLLQQGP